MARSKKLAISFRVDPATAQQLEAGKLIAFFLEPDHLENDRELEEVNRELIEELLELKRNLEKARQVESQLRDNLALMRGEREAAEGSLHVALIENATLKVEKGVLEGERDSLEEELERIRRSLDLTFQELEELRQGRAAPSAQAKASRQAARRRRKGGGQ